MLIVVYIYIYMCLILLMNWTSQGPLSGIICSISQLELHWTGLVSSSNVEFTLSQGVWNGEAFPNMFWVVRKRSENARGRLQHLKGSLKLDLSHLTPNEAQQLEDLVMESADVIALELGSTKLVSHPIDTSASPPINQPTSRIAFALCQTVEEMVQKMLEQGVVEQSHSPW